jgi:hypothetical protein
MAMHNDRQNAWNCHQIEAPAALFGWNGIFEARMFLWGWLVVISPWFESAFRGAEDEQGLVAYYLMEKYD